MALPAGWYPMNPDEWVFFTRKWDTEMEYSTENQVLGGVFPHAGWYYSGLYAYEVCRALSTLPDLIVILGGHMRSGDEPLIWDYSSCETPFGDVPLAGEINQRLRKAFPFQDETYPDNTMEVYLPLIRKIFPHIPLVAMRIPPESQWLERAGDIASIISGNSDNPFWIASADLTHYGSNYGFEPPESRDSPLQWVEKNDHNFISNLLKGDSAGLLESSRRYRNCCSPGSAAFLLEVMKRQYGNPAGKLVRYGTSLDKGGSESFVGYASVVFER